MFKKALQQISKFYEQDFKTPEQAQNMLSLLKGIIFFDSCAVFYLVPNQLQLQFHTGGEFRAVYEIDDEVTRILYNTKTENISDSIKNTLNIPDYVLSVRLKVKGTVLGIICITRKLQGFSEDEEIIFKIYAGVISGIIKDIELSKILSQQAKTLEKGLRETHRAYETVKKQNKKIVENEKLQNQFLANISHDLRTPLNSIICLSEVLSSNMFGKLNLKQQEYIEDIRISGIRLLGMINEVLDITKLESHTINLNITEVDTEQLLKEVCNILKPLCDKKKIKIIFDNPSNYTIYGDYIKLQQVFFNIIGNAIKFSPENSTINIKVIKNNKYVEIAVKDHGIGISKSNQNKIFKKFYQAENALSKSEISTGLGLTIAKEFVKLHKGEISVCSELRKGSEFTIKLPVSND